MILYSFIGLCGIVGGMSLCCATRYEYRKLKAHKAIKKVEREWKNRKSHEDKVKGEEQMTDMIRGTIITTPENLFPAY